jgi:hypothetical protein
LGGRLDLNPSLDPMDAKRDRAEDYRTSGPPTRMARKARLIARCTGPRPLDGAPAFYAG